MDHILCNKVENDQDLPQDWKIFNINYDSKEPLFIDTFRHFWPERKLAFTCWNTEKNCRENNFGTRIDYILTCQPMLETIENCDIQPEIEGSDHCPVFIGQVSHQHLVSKNWPLGGTTKRNCLF